MKGVTEISNAPRAFPSESQVEGLPKVPEKPCLTATVNVFQAVDNFTSSEGNRSDSWKKNLLEIVVKNDDLPW